PNAPPVRGRFLFGQTCAIRGTPPPQDGWRGLPTDRGKRPWSHQRLTKQELYRPCLHREPRAAPWRAWRASNTRGARATSHRNLTSQTAHASRVIGDDTFFSSSGSPGPRAWAPKV